MSHKCGKCYGDGMREYDQYGMSKSFRCPACDGTGECDCDVVEIKPTGGSHWRDENTGMICCPHAKYCIRCGAEVNDG